MKTRKFCPHCGRPVVKSWIEGYAFQCHACDEDFYRFEVLTTRRIEQVRAIRQNAFRQESQRGDKPSSFQKPYPAPKRHHFIRHEAKVLQLVEDENGAELCYCNNCGCYLIDNNPQSGAKKYDTTIVAGELEQFVEPTDEGAADDEEYFWGCPNCETDKFLIDA